MVGTDWDVDGAVRQVAISTAGEYLRSQKHASLLGQLLRIFSDERQDRVFREAAYFARAVGREWNELPSAARHLDLVTGIDPVVVTQAEQRLATG